MAARKGLEPLTFALGKRCSILLSYRADAGVIAHLRARANGGADAPAKDDQGRARAGGSKPLTRLGFLLIAVVLLVAGCRDRAALDRLAAVGEGKVVRLISADAVLLADGRTVRLAGIVAPREGEPYAAQARAALENLAVGQTVELLSGGARQDAYGRTLAHLRRKKGRLWVQGALLDAGAARVRTYDDNRALAAPMLEREARARRAGRGLWADRAYQVLLPQEAVNTRGFAIVEGRAAAVRSSRLGDDIQLSDGGSGVEAQIPGGARNDFAAAGKAAAAMKGRLIRVRGTLRADRTLRIDHPELLEVLAEPRGPAK